MKPRVFVRRWWRGREPGDPPEPELWEQQARSGRGAGPGQAPADSHSTSAARRTGQPAGERA